MASMRVAQSAAMSETEKPAVQHDDGGLPPDVAALFAEFSGPKYKKLMRKMDLHIIPIVRTWKLRWFHLTELIAHI